MIDLHCHILPELDDGARDLDDALGMAWQAEADGIEAVCATPHIRHDHDVRIRELPARLDQLSVSVAAAGCRTRILAGGEVAAGALDRLDDDELARVSLGGSGRWILLEPAPGALDDSLDEAVHRLGERGFRALIAHPERHLAADLIERLRRLARQGALVQATADFLVQEPTRAGMLDLARAGVIHTLGSDAHSSRAGRPVALNAALRVLRTLPRLAPHVDWIGRVAPQAIVAGRELTPPF
ncbi:MAG TPA: CpsB/CapC family capsule biosynthesis tyrosine phosphatase [Solirubrobacteraceae bacterium]|nr:CpsB/CapC family capsule biosynthesis tyrosine phosphatase [Solirubrobacteraceae bacterium]